MDCNIVHTLIEREHFIGCYAGDLQHSLATFNRVMTTCLHLA